MPTFKNSFEGGTDGTTVTTGNSGGASGDAFETVGGTVPPTYEADASAHGAMGLQCAATNDESFVGWGPKTAAGTYYARCYLKNMANPPAACKIMTLRSGSTTVTRVSVNTVGKVFVTDTAGSAQGAASTITVTGRATPVRIEVMAVGGLGTAGSVECKIFLNPDSTTPDETLTRSGFSTGATTIDGIRFGPNGTVITSTVLLDDVAFSDAGYIGPEVLPTVEPLELEGGGFLLSESGVPIG